MTLLVPYIKAGVFYFEDTYESITDKIKNHCNATFKEEKEEVFGKSFHKLIIEKTGTSITYNLSSSYVLNFYFLNQGVDLVLEDLHLFDSSYADLLAYFRQKDEHFIKLDGSFISKKYGIQVAKQPNRDKAHSVLFYSQQMFDEPVDLDGVIRSVMGDDFDF